MPANRGYISRPLSFNRQAVIASASITREKNAIHALTEVDISEPRRLIRRHFEKTGEKLSLTAYIVTCLARTLANHPELNSFIKGRKQIFLQDITISVLIERELEGEKVPEPVGISAAQTKSYREIHQEIIKARNDQSKTLGGLSGQTWFRFIPGFLLKVFIRLADKNLYLAKKYGKVAVTAVGMFSKDAVWFIPHGTPTLLITVGSIINKVVGSGERFESREHLCLTVSFDHNIADGAPATRFLSQFTEIIRSGELLIQE